MVEAARARARSLGAHCRVDDLARVEDEGRRQRA
jgi:hypothetical protein